MAEPKVRAQRIRNCCITWNNPPLPKIGPFSQLPDQITYLVWSLECGAKGTEHWQMYAEFKNPITVAAIKKLFGNDKIHVEKRRGTAAQAAAYCKKLDETHLSGPWELGELSHQGQDLTAKMEKQAQNEVLLDLKKGFTNVKDVPVDMLRSCPQGIKMALTLAPPVRRQGVAVYYIEGATGIGKTFGIFKRFPDAYRPLAAGDKLWFDGYCGEKTLLLDELRGNIKLSYLLQLLDPYPLKVEIKGGTVNAEWTRVFITTNTPPERWYPRISTEDPRTFAALLRRIGQEPRSPNYIVAKSSGSLERWFIRTFEDPTRLEPDKVDKTVKPPAPPPKPVPIADHPITDWFGADPSTPPAITSDGSVLPQDEATDIDLS